MSVRCTSGSIVLVVVALLAPAPATAHNAAVVVASDAAGDANFINSNSLTNLTPTSGPDTRPASIQGADLVNLRFSTPYSTTKTLDADGSVRRVDYTATAFRVQIEMSGDVLPTFGPTLIFRILTNIGGCDAWFEAVVRGSVPPAAEDPHRADIRIPSGCANPPRSSGTVSAGFSLDVSGRTITMTYPFDAFTGPSIGGLVRAGTRIDPDTSSETNSNATHVRMWAPTLAVTAGTIDEAPRPASFVVGSDVPPSVDCSATPTHQDCQG